MPQASDRDRGRARALFGSIDLSGPKAYLEKRGFKLTENWHWIPPQREISEEEAFAIYFLAVEWDFGGLFLEGPEGVSIRL